MTIEEHISRIKARGFKYKEDKEIAIRSLEAWEKVKAEIASLKGDNFPNSYYIKIIDKHLQAESEG